MVSNHGNSDKKQSEYQNELEKRLTPIEIIKKMIINELDTKIK